MSDTKPESIKDADGRTIGLRKLTVVDQAKILRAIGPKQSENQPYVQMVEIACMAASIDGIPLPFPMSEQQIDVTLGKLGDAGVNALYGIRLEEMQKGIAAAEAAAAEGVKPAGPLMQ